jgi:nicotinate-nucleotide adenylyltransferase
MRIGLLGGTFDPVHVGHLDVARAARDRAGLDAVWLVPARTPPHRHQPHASAAHRFAMVALAVASEAGLLASDLEMEAEGPSYTAHTLDRLASRGHDLAGVSFVIGADAFRDIRTWRDYPQVLDRCDFVVVSRPGVSARGLPEALPELVPRMVHLPCERPPRPGILLVDAPTSPVSSTDVRGALARGAPLEDLVPPAVRHHIVRHGLYRNAGQSGSSGKEPHEDTVTPAS